jgi:hypothetical protein
MFIWAQHVAELKYVGSDNLLDLSVGRLLPCYRTFLDRALGVCKKRIRY